MKIPGARLKWVSEKGTESYTNEPGVIISLGREPGNDVVIPLVSISRNHARIEWIGTTYVLNDLGSANGTYVNGQKVARAPWILSHGDRILLDTFPLRFELVEIPTGKITPKPRLSETPKSREAVTSSRGKPADSTRNNNNVGGISEIPTVHLPQTMGLHPSMLPQADITIINGNNANSQYFPRPRLPRLIVSNGVDAGRTFDLASDVIHIGQAAPDAKLEIQLNDSSIAPRHARLELHGGNYWLHDLGSGTGIVLNERRVTDAVFLMEGDIIMIGNTQLIFRGA